MAKNKADAPVAQEWTYSNYRATLKRNGKFFALVTGGIHGEALSPEDAALLLKKLNQKTPNEN